MEEQACPRCKTTKYRNPNLKLMVNVCGHSLCENCVELLFVRGSGACIECGIPLRRNNFRLQMFEDAYVEKEVDIRKKILRDYNKKEEDFPTLRDYNDYLEEVETIVFNLTNGIDVEDTKRRVEMYRRENQDTIKRNRSKLSKEEEELEVLIEREKEELEEHRQRAHEEELLEMRSKRKQKEALLDELMFSDLPAKHIMATHRQEVSSQQEQKASIAAQKPTKFSTGIRMGKQERFLPIAPMEEGQLYVYNPITLDIKGPEAPQWEDLHIKGYLDHIRPASSQERGGGYQASIACQRALQDAFCGLFFSPSEADCKTRLQATGYGHEHAMSMTIH